MHRQSCSSKVHCNALLVAPSSEDVLTVNFAEDKQQLLLDTGSVSRPFTYAGVMSRIYARTAH
jgi:hypothetical protein